MAVFRSVFSYISKVGGDDLPLIHIKAEFNILKRVSIVSFRELWGTGTVYYLKPAEHLIIEHFAGQNYKNFKFCFKYSNFLIKYFILVFLILILIFIS